jgi:GR25 family glycosyltransferase involved in LPS biosynthesis
MISYYIIHCEKHVERLKNIERVQKSLDVNIFNGVEITCAEISDKFPEITFVESGFRNTGELGCYLSHYSLLKEIKDKPGYSVIFEDDVKFEEGLYEKIEKISWEEFDMVFLGNLQNARGAHVKHNIYKPPRGALWGTHALLFKNENVHKIIDALTTMEMAIDNQYKNRIDEGRINAFVIQPNLCVQNKGLRSTIK